MAFPSVKSQLLEEATAVVQRLRVALARVLSEIPGEIRTAADLQRVLSIRKTLAWQVFRMTKASDALAEATKLPGPRALERFFAAARKQAVPVEAVDEARRALADFGQLVHKHAGNRAAFDTMMGSFTERGDPADTIALRRDAFNANCALWGVSVRTQVMCFFCHRSQTPGLTDGASIRGFNGIRRLRQGAEFDLSMFIQVPSAPVTNEDQIQHHIKFVLDEYCTQPIQEIIEHRPKDGGIETVFSPGRVGKLGAADLYMASILREMDRDEPEEERNRILNSVLIKRPTEVLILDTLVESSLFAAAGGAGSLTPSAAVYGSLQRPDDPIATNYSEGQLLPVPVQVDRLGPGSRAVATPDVPRYPEMVAQVCERAGWDPERFHVYRCRVPYPILNTIITVHFRLR